MDGSIRARIAIAFLLVAAPGCTTAQLRRTTINQTETVHDIYQQQVLDNLAMFVHNRGSYPYFSLIGTGTTTLTDSATLADTNSWMRNTAGLFLYSAAGLNPSLMRSKMGSWATFPINDSVKLTVMRCVYHAAVDGCVGAAGESCPDCDNLFYAYYNMEPPPGSDSIPYHNGPPNNPDDPNNTPFFSGTLSDDAGAGGYTVKTIIPFGSQDQFKGFTLQVNSTHNYRVESSGSYTNPTSSKDSLTMLVLSRPLEDEDKGKPFTLWMQKRPPIRGIVTPECLAFQQGWFCHGKNLPKHFDKCTPHGYYCGTYIWVPPGGIDQLTKLTLLIQDLAYYDPPQAGTQAVSTQKTTNTPAPKDPKTIAQVRKVIEAKELELTHLAASDLKRGQLLTEIEALRALMVQPEETTRTTTITTTTPPSRQPSTFQPSILNLQQDLNLIPPRQ